MREIRPSRAAAALLAGASIVGVGCDGMGPFKKKTPPRVFVPPAPIIRTMPELREPVLENPPEIAFDLTLESEVVVLAALMPGLPEPPVAPPPPAAAKTKPAPPVAPVEAPPAPPAERPKLTPIYTQADVNAFNREIDQKLERVRGVLAVAAGKNLTGAQKETVQQIRSLQTLAEQARRQDLATAVDYARRADLLAIDLAGRLP